MHILLAQGGLEGVHPVGLLPGHAQLLAAHVAVGRQLAAYGHIGREDLGVAWEKTDRVDALKAAVAE